MARAVDGATRDAILAQPWPPDLDPARVPFRQRTITVLKGMKLWDDMTRIDTITRDDVRGYWVTRVVVQVVLHGLLGRRSLTKGDGPGSL